MGARPVLLSNTELLLFGPQKITLMVPGWYLTLKSPPQKSLGTPLLPPHPSPDLCRILCWTQTVGVVGPRQWVLDPDSGLSALLWAPAAG